MTEKPETPVGGDIMGTTDSVEMEDGKAGFKKTVIRFIVTRYYMGLLLWVAVIGFYDVLSVHVFRIPATLSLFTYLALGLWYFSAREKVVSDKGGS